MEHADAKLIERGIPKLGVEPSTIDLLESP
jgi:hypothetical protein